MDDEQPGPDPERLQDLEKKADDLRAKLVDIDPTVTDEEVRPPEREEEGDGSSSLA